jgi:hypothetical protein
LIQIPAKVLVFFAKNGIMAVKNGKEAPYGSPG